MHDMSNTRKEIAARLGFAAKEVFAADKRTTAGALRKALKAKGITSAADLEWHGISAKDPDSTPYWLYEDGSMEKIKASRPGAKAEFAAHPSWSEGILGKDTDPKLAAYSWISKNNIESGRKQMLLADLAAGMYEKNPSMSIAQAVLAAAKDMVSKGVATRDIQQWAENGGKFARPGAKTRMTREQTEEQKAGLKIMSAADPAVGAKIATLIKEGKPQDQAVAIALDMKRRGEL